MDSNYVLSDEILNILSEKWCKSNINHYSDFIKHLDIGIVPIIDRDVITDKYKIVNEKKWFLAKIKYGF
jgi:hypothetical protein